MYFVVVLCGLGVSVSFVDGHQCTLPNGDMGRCKPLGDCEILTKMSKKHRSQKDVTFLAQSQCSSDDGTESEVCCPTSDVISCLTPDYYEGRCVGLETCPHLSKLATANYTVLKEYQCAGPEDDSVCCGLEEIYIAPADMECQENATSFPSDPGSDCCGLDTTFGNKILGGNDTAIDEYPWMAVIEYVKNNDRYLLCDGCLISARYVLTAAHCVRGPVLFIGRPKYVRLGEYNVATRGPDCTEADGGSPDCTEGAFIVPIQKTVAHPQFLPYHADGRHDIGLIRLQITAPYTSFIRPICLPTMNYRISQEKLAFKVAGWGTYKQSMNGDDIVSHRSPVKQHVILPYVEKQKCEESVRKLKRNPNAMLYEGQICAGGDVGKDSCSADSGGPLMYERDRVFQVVGIVSYGTEVCGLRDIPGVYTHVFDYIPWILKTIKP